MVKKQSNYLIFELLVNLNDLMKIELGNSELVWDIHFI
jgi:hypothetical protein